MNPTSARDEMRTAAATKGYQDEHMRFNFVLKWHARLFRHRGRYAVQKLGRAPVCSVARWTFTGSIFWWSSSRISWPPSAQVA
jgi:hypothetical protein